MPRRKNAVVHVSRSGDEFKCRQVSRERRDVPDVTAFQLRDELRIYVLIADAVGNDVEAGVHQALSIGEMEEVRGYSQIALVCLVNQRSIHVGAHVVRAAVEPRLDEIYALRVTLGHQRARLFRRRADGARAPMQTAAPGRAAPLCSRRSRARFRHRHRRARTRW